MSFGQIVGQELPIRILKSSLAKDRVAGAYLFYGPAGVGKKLTALNIAKLVNCYDPSDEPCDRCDACRRIDNYGHPDVSIIARDPEAKDLKIEQIRQLEENIYLKPFEGKKKVFIIEEAGDMNEQAQNALLKTLEEPPADSILILLTRNMQNLLETIRSRCLRLRFNRLSAGRIKEILAGRLGLNEEQAMVLARVSEGSLEKVSGAEEYWKKRARIAEKISAGFLGLSRDNEWLDWDREETAQLLNFISGWCRDTALIKLGIDDPTLLMNPDYKQQLTDFSSRYDLDRLLEIIEQIRQTMELIDGNINIQLALEVLWDQCIE